MSMMRDLLRVRRDVFGGDAVSRPWMKRAAGLGLNFLLGFSMPFARVFTSCAPFGLGMVARAGGGGAGALCLAGAVLG